MKKQYSTDKQCLACGIVAPGRNALHHVKTRGAGGCDCAFNLMPLCLEHHNMVHNSGLVKFAQRYIKVYTWLKDNGWTFYELTGKWIHFPTKENICSCTVGETRK